jgi:hypothetical protein
MSQSSRSAARGNLSLVLSALALLVATSGTAYAVAKGSVKTRHLADGAVTAAKLRDGAVTTPRLRDGAVTGSKVADRSLRLRDLGGSITDRVTTTSSAVSIPAAQCTTISLTLFNPVAPELLGSMVVGTITTSSGGAVVSNSGAVFPTLLTATSQGGAIPRLGVCAGSSSQVIPAGSIITWSLVEP